MKTTKTKVRVLTVFVLLGTNTWAQSLNKQNAQIKQAKQSSEKTGNINLFKILANSSEIDVKKDIKDAVFLEIDFAELARINKEKPSSLILDLPLSGTSKATFYLNAVKIVSDNFSIITEDNKKVDYTPGLYYQGAIAGNTPSLAAWSLFENSIMTVFSCNNQNYNLGLWRDKSNVLNNIYILYKDSDVLYGRKFECLTNDLSQNNTSKSIIPENPKPLSTNCIKIYIECDYQMYLDNGSNVANVANYVTGMFNVVQLIYSNEAVPTEMSQIYVWSTADPYISDTTSNGILDSFLAYRTTFNGNLAHFLTTRSLGVGGLAYVDVICSPDYAYAMSNIDNTYLAYPNWSWTIAVFVHEMGHNLGSLHTTWCGWPGGPIDDCGPVEDGPCAPGPTPPINGGTMMSGCNSPGTFTNGFGPLPGDKIRTQYAAATCLTACTFGILPVAAFTSTPSSDCTTPLAVNFTDQSTESPTSWTWDIDNNGSADYSTQSPSHTYSIAGTYSVKLTVTNANGSNSITKTNYITVNSNALPLMEGFENATFPPAKWSVTQSPVDATTWERNTTAAGNGASTASVFIGYYGYITNLEEKDNLITKAVSLIGVTNATITFKVAYKNWPDTVNYDTLKVFVSTDCGVTYGTAIYTKGGNILATNGSSTDGFTPTVAGDWRTETISLNSFVGNNIIVKFEGTNRYGNDLYLDDINITEDITTGIENATENALTVSIYPNPFSTTATIEIKGLTQPNCELKIYDLLGKEVLNSIITNSKSEIHKGDLSSGIYLYKVFNKNEIIGKGKITIK